MFLFFIGIIEMIIVTSWTKVVSDTKVIASGVITMVNVLVWYYVLQTILEDVSNWRVVVWYAFGCAVGTMLTSLFFRMREQKSLASKEQQDTPAASSNVL